MDGFANALTPGNLLFAAIGVLLGTAIGVLPGHRSGDGRGAAAAGDLRVRPDRRVHHVRRDLLRRPCSAAPPRPSCSTRPGRARPWWPRMEGNPMARSGRGAQALAAAAIGHFIGGMIGAIVLVLLAPTDRHAGRGHRRPGLLRGDGAGLRRRDLRARAAPGSAGSPRWLIGLTIGLVGLDPLTGQARLTFGIPQLADGIDVVIVAVGLFAVGEALWVAAHLRRTPVQPIPVGRPWLCPADLRRTWKAVAARALHRLPVRRHPGRRRGDPDLPVLRHREAAVQAPRRVRQGRHRGRRRARSRRPPRRRRAPSRRCSRSACPPRRSPR